MLTVTVFINGIRVSHHNFVFGFYLTWAEYFADCQWREGVTLRVRFDNSVYLPR